MSGLPTFDAIDRTHREIDALLAFALPLSTLLSRVAEVGETEKTRSERSEGDVTPPGAAFAIWAPIFACLAAYGLRRDLGRRRQPDAAGLAGATLATVSLAANILWSLNAQLRGLGWTSLGLIGAGAAAATGATAAYEESARRTGRGGAFADLLAPLAGWLSVAGFANLDTTLNEKRGRPEPEARIDRTLPILAVASAAVTAGTALTRGNLLYAAAAAWGLGGIAYKNRASAPVSGAAMLGVAALALSTAAARRTR